MNGKWLERKTGSENKEDILLRAKKDRRILSFVPDPHHIRQKIDRRGTLSGSAAKTSRERMIEDGIRYQAEYPVTVLCIQQDGTKRKFTGTSLDISSTGMLLRVPALADQEALRSAKKIGLRFEIVAGSMPEGYEMNVRVFAAVAREQSAEDGSALFGLMFRETLAQFATRHKNINMIIVSSVMMFFIVLMVVLMRVESVIYFHFNRILYSYSIVAAVFLLTRYLFGAVYRPVPINTGYTPSVTIIIPCFNEEEWIDRTILCCINQDYPLEQLEVIIVDDCSSDNSVAVIQKTIEMLREDKDRFQIGSRVRFVVQERNKGKREAMALGAQIAQNELVVFVDSDSFLNPFAIRNLVQPFQDPSMGGVAGRTDVANTYTNSLTKMQSVRYYIAFRIMKAAEAHFDAVTCLSGPLSCYRRALVLEYMDEWLNQRFLGHKATFGDDRSMTNLILRHHRTYYQDTAVCSTIVPKDYKSFLKQQMRWKRSWLRESILAGSFMWRKEPLMSVFFYIGMLVPIAAPAVVVYNLLYVPLLYSVFPTTFLLGLLAMALMMSAAQLLLRKSSTWLFGLLFCVLYEAVLLWQMPVAWFTFWKSTWGTRMTEADVAESKKQTQKRRKEQPQATEETSDERL